MGMIAFWVIKPVPDAVLFARTTSQLVIAVDAVDWAGRDTDVRNRDGDDTAFAFSSSRRALSDFLAGNAARVLGVQAVILARIGWFLEIAASGGHRVNVVLNAARCPMRAVWRMARLNTLSNMMSPLKIAAV